MFAENDDNGLQNRLGPITHRATLIRDGLRARVAVERPVGARRSRVLLVPWELALLGLAGWAYLELRRGQAVVQVEQVAQAKLVLVAFPLLFLVGAALLGVRLLAATLRPLRRRAARLPAAGYLAASRITAAPAVSMLLLAAMSLPVAMVGYASGITSTVRYTVQAKVRLFTGGQVALLAADPIQPTPEVDPVGTVVRRYFDARIGGISVTVLAVQPDTLPRWAFWAADQAGGHRPAGGLSRGTRRSGFVRRSPAGTFPTWPMIGEPCCAPGSRS